MKYKLTRHSTGVVSLTPDGIDIVSGDVVDSKEIDIKPEEAQRVKLKTVKRGKANIKIKGKTIEL